jgi:hypothetical protein
MVRRALLAALAAVLQVGCDWANLGPEATLRDASLGDDAAGDASKGDASAIGDAAEDYPCGLKPDPNDACNTCNVQHCCDFDKQCALDPRCVAGVYCTLDCVFDPACVSHCDDLYADAGVFLTLTNCAITQCINDCLPGQECLQLAQCCPRIADVTTRNVCIGTVNFLDEARCRNMLDNVLLPQFGPQFCPGPQDGGAD